MEYYKHPPELSPPSPEPVQDPALEFVAPPPEFGQGSGPGPEPRKKSRLRQLLAIPALLLCGFLFLHETRPVSLTPEGPTEPIPAETAAPIPELPAGSLVLDLLYAVRDGDTVRYSYTAYAPIPSLDASEAQSEGYSGQLWPVSVYTRVTDEAGATVAPVEDPDIWESSRAAFPYSLDAADLEGELTLTLTAVYTEAGEQRQTQVERVLPELPPTPETGATLTSLGGGEIDYSAQFIPQAEDSHDYQLRFTDLSFVWFDAAGEPCAQSLALEPDTLPELRANADIGGFAADYSGPARLEAPTADAVQFCARLILTDQSTGYPYTIDSNLLPVPKEPILSGSLQVASDGSAEAEFRFTPAPGDTREYELQVALMGQTAYQGEEIMGFSLVDDPRSVPVSGDRESGYSVSYSGGTAAAMIPRDAQLSLYVILEDLLTGERWTLETNRVDSVMPEKSYETWPLGDGKITIMVYNDTPDIVIPTNVETGTGLTVLATTTLPESEFDSYELPPARSPGGYDFAGWVIHVNNPMDLSSQTNLFAEYDGDPPVDALLGEDSFAFPVSGTLTKEDVERVPPSEDGVRYVNVHPVWIVRDPEEELILLDDGDGNVTAYGMESPIASEGYLYLCNYPVPEREGLVFDGWYDDDGKRVDMLVCYFSFVPMLQNADGSFAGYDWGSYVPVHLTAHWR